MKALFAAVAFTTFGQVAQAAEPSTPPATAPLVLSDTQMDQVTAGGIKDDKNYDYNFKVNVLRDNRIFDVQVDAVSGEAISSREDMDD
jgi:hypothetical protein